MSDCGTWKLTGGTATESGTFGSISSFANVNNIATIDATDADDVGTASAPSGGNSFATTWTDSW